MWRTDTTKRVEVELDGTVVAKWKAEEDGHIVNCYIGMRQRGDLSKFFIMPLGMSHCVGEGRVNPESSEAYHSICQMALGDSKHNLISITDRCSSHMCRCERCCNWFEEHHSVNHFRKPLGEFSRPTGAVTADVATLATRPAKAGTVTIAKE